MRPTIICRLPPLFIALNFLHGALAVATVTGVTIAPRNGEEPLN